jgi:Rrf2 family iron-sulfur cluster assembly transcriptional regulator
MFSKTCEYAIKIMIYIASRHEDEGIRAGLEDISKAIDSPKAFTAKILQQLSRAKLLDSLRGRSGGFLITKNRIIILADIVLAIDGDGLTNGCVLGFKVCDEKHPCPVHFKYKALKETIKFTLLNTSLSELKERITSKDVFLVE